MTSESRRAVAFALAEATRRTGWLSSAAPAGRPAVVQADHGRPQAQRFGEAQRRVVVEGGVDEQPRAGDLGQQRVAWTQRSTGPGRRRPSDARPAPGGTVRALAVAPQHGLPVAQVAQRPNRQLPPPGE